MDKTPITSEEFVNFLNENGVIDNDHIEKFPIIGKKYGHKCIIGHKSGGFTVHTLYKNMNDNYTLYYENNGVGIKCSEVKFIDNTAIIFRKDLNNFQIVITSIEMF